MIASQSLLLFENWKCVREFRDPDKFNYYAISSKGITMPLGYTQFLPGFEHVPIFVIAGSKNINLLSLADDKKNK